MLCTLMVPGWMPVPLNQLLGSKHKRSRLKGQDRDVLGRAFLLYGKPLAGLKRRVSLHVVLPKGRRAPDPDALWKSCLDALVYCGALVNDSSRWCTPERPTFSRGEALCSFITLEDVP